MRSARRVALLVLAIIETLFFSGIIAGFPSLQYVLVVRGIYGSSCFVADNQTSGDKDLKEYFKNLTQFGACKSQTEPLTLAFSCALFVGSFSLLLSGPILDSCGYRILKLIALIIFALGIICLALTDIGRDWLIFPSLILVGTSGVQSLLTNLKTAKFYPGYETIVTTVISAAFDSSAVNFQFLKLAYLNGIPYFNFLAGYGVAGVVIFIINFFLYPSDSNLSEYSPTTPILQENENGQRQQSARPIPTFLKTIMSLQFLLYIAQFCLNFLEVYFLVSCNNIYISYHLAQGLQTVRKYSGIFSYMLMAGILCCPLPSLVFWIQKRTAPDCQSPETLHKSVIIPFLIASILGVAVLVLYIVAPKVQYLYFIYPIVVIFRTFTFSSGFAYASVAFPSEYFGKLLGVGYTAIAFSCLLVFPLNLWLHTSRGPFYLLLGLSIMTFANPIYIYFRT